MVFTGGKERLRLRGRDEQFGDEVKKYLYKILGTKGLKKGELRFYTNSNKVRGFSNKYNGYKEGNMSLKELQDYFSKLRNTTASNRCNAINYLDAMHFNGVNEFTVR